jgi:hypothetical protein
MAIFEYRLDEKVTVFTMNDGENRFNPFFLKGFLEGLDGAGNATASGAFAPDGPIGRGGRRHQIPLSRRIIINQKPSTTSWIIPSDESLINSELVATFSKFGKDSSIESKKAFWKN